MVQTAIMPDGGIASQPYQYFKENEATYRYIDERLDGTRRSYLDADHDTRIRLLHDISSYALLTARVPVVQADRGFKVYRDHYPEIDPEYLGPDFQDNGLGFFNNKSEYIYDNLNNPQLFDEVDSLLVSNRTDNAQERLMEARGLGPAKAAFALAMLGFKDHACLDANVCKYLGLDPRAYDKSDAAEYKGMVDSAFEAVPELQGEIPNFLLQWVIFDLQRGEIEPHDLWFNHVTEITS